MGVEKHSDENIVKLDDIQPLCLKVSYLTRKEMSLLKPNLLVSRLTMNGSSVSFQCFVSLKLPFRMLTLTSLMLWPFALK